jgi:RimJ/RimL family protein N-acetyltransferase
VELLATVPDLPRWVEARGMLLTGRGAIVETGLLDPPTVVASPTVMLAVVLRWDQPETLARALRQVPREFSIVGPAEAEDAVSRVLPKRPHERATLFHLPAADAGRLAPSADAHLLSTDEYGHLDNLPPILRGELRDARAYSPIASAFADERPVAFCYSGWETEKHWDVSIDTLESHRRRGLGAAASTCLIRHFAALGKTAVWGAVDSNPASTALAEKLGFTAVDRLMVLYPDDGH